MPMVVLARLTLTAASMAALPRNHSAAHPSCSFTWPLRWPLAAASLFRPLLYSAASHWLGWGNLCARRWLLPPAPIPGNFRPAHYHECLVQCPIPGRMTTSHPPLQLQLQEQEIDGLFTLKLTILIFPLVRN